MSKEERRSNWKKRDTYEVSKELFKIAEKLQEKYKKKRKKRKVVADIADPVIARTEKEESQLHERVKKGDMIKKTGAYGEPIYFKKTGGDLPSSTRQAIDDVRKQELERNIKKEKKRKSLLA